MNRSTSSRSAPKPEVHHTIPSCLTAQRNDLRSQLHMQLYGHRASYHTPLPLGTAQLPPAASRAALWPEVRQTISRCLAAQRNDLRLLLLPMLRYMLLGPESKKRGRGLGWHTQRVSPRMHAHDKLLQTSQQPQKNTKTLMARCTIDVGDCIFLPDPPHGADGVTQQMDRGDLSVRLEDLSHCSVEQRLLCHLLLLRQTNVAQESVTIRLDSLL